MSISRGVWEGGRASAQATSRRGAEREGTARTVHHTRGATVGEAIPLRLPSVCQEALVWRHFDGARRLFKGLFEMTVCQELKKVVY
jgi:hypothetical protein